MWISLLLLFSNPSLAEDFLQLKYSAKTGDSLKKIVVSFLKPGVPPVKANNSLILTMKQNSGIKIWNPLAADTVFDLYLDKEIVDLAKYDAFAKLAQEIKPVVAEKEKIVEKEKVVEKVVEKVAEKEKVAEVESAKKPGTNHHLNVFTMPSFGSFTQENSKGYSVSYNQISPLSLGLGYGYAPAGGLFQASASFYYSTILAVSNHLSSGENADVAVPGEFGGNGYGLYKPSSSQFSYFAGFDLESFSVFNMQNISTNNTIVIDNIKVYYATLGANYIPRAMDKFLLKLSFAKSVVSTYTPALAAGTPVEISGYKILLFMNYQITEKWSVSAMLKSHNFSGDNALTINRLGLGVSYFIF